MDWQARMTLTYESFGKEVIFRVHSMVLISVTVDVLSFCLLSIMRIESLIRAMYGFTASPESECCSVWYVMLWHYNSKHRKYIHQKIHHRNENIWVRFRENITHIWITFHIINVWTMDYAHPFYLSYSVRELIDDVQASLASEREQIYFIREKQRWISLNVS